MQAMVFEEAGHELSLRKVPIPTPSGEQVLIKIIACGVCRTDLHILDGELDHPKLPLIPGHEIIGRIVATGSNVIDRNVNDIVGVPWLGYTCGHCKFCRQGQENLCDNPLFTGYTIDGGFAEYTVADARFCLVLDDRHANGSSTPLLCAGLIGFRSYRMIASNATNIGLFGFGAAAHLIIQIAKAQDKNIFAFTRAGDRSAREFALKMGASWAGDSSSDPPQTLDAAIIFASAGELIPRALRVTNKGGQVICGGIHMSEIPAFSYDLLWGEREIKSVANLTRKDGVDFFDILKQVPVQAQTTSFKLAEANEAIRKLRNGEITGAAVLVMDN